MNKIQEYLERNSKTITDTYRIEDISGLTKLNCMIAETLLKIEGAKSGTVQTSKASTRTTKKSK